MKAIARPSGSAEDLAYVERFFGDELSLPPNERLRDTELAKIKDLADDVAREEKWTSEARQSAPTLIGRVGEWALRFPDAVFPWVFSTFERVVGSLAQHRPARAHGCHEPPSGASARPLCCAADFWLFDRMSQRHGGKFRGSVIANCFLGVVASTALLFSLSPPFGAQAMIDRFHDAAGNVPAATLIEFVCITLIGLVYARGRTSEQDDEAEQRTPPRMGPHLGSQRWHQRWLEYRLLAERFRYVDLLVPLGPKAVSDISIAAPGDARRMWHQRYFESRVREVVRSGGQASVVAPAMTLRAYRDHALAVMAQQERYHRDNHRRRGAIAQHLHTAAKLAFFSTLLICVVEFLWDMLGEQHSSAMLALSCVAPDNFRMTLLFLAGVLPVISAATYAIVTHAEYTKVADTSAETFERVHQLYKELAALPVPEGLVSAEGLAPMRPLVLQFAGVAITEATGWRAMLRDKNVPLA